MRLKIHGMLLSLFFALAVCLSFGIEASAHEYPRSDGQHTYTHPDVEGVTAEDVETAADKEAMTSKFLLHAATHLNLIVTDEGLDENKAHEKSREAVIFSKNSRKKGVFNHGDTYIIGITKRGAMTNHGRYKGTLYGSRYFDDANPVKEPIKTLITAGKLSDGSTPTCTPYEYDGKQRTACAIRQNSLSGEITTIAGYDHAKEDLIRPDCSGFTLEVTAEQVEKETDLVKKKEFLKSYVKGVINVFFTLQQTLGVEIVTEIPSLISKPQELGMELNARIREKTICFKKEPDLFYGSIYAFVMDPTQGISFLNGFDFDLHGLSVSLEDPNPIGDEANVLTAFQKALTDGTGDLSKLAEGNSATVRYHWDDPRTEEDNVEDYLEKGVVPGSSIKESYLKVVNISKGNPGFPAFYYVFGSGIYLDDDDDGGCAIAGTGSTHQSALLNLLLVASVLFPAVFLRRRV